MCRDAVKKVGAGGTASAVLTPMPGEASGADPADPGLARLFRFNRDWARRVEEAEPGFFEKLSRLQAPDYLWIGCSDSRVPANQIVGLLPGEVFVHRNVANVVAHTDLNCLSVVEYAIDVLQVKHIMVVGHYGCGGVTAAYQKQRIGLVDLWLRHVQDVHAKHAARIDALPAEARVDKLCELNVLEQVLNLSHTMIVQNAWLRGQDLTVHGWVYGLRDGLMRDLGMTVGVRDDIEASYAAALDKLF